MSMYPYTIIRSNRKSLSLQIKKDQSIIVRAPGFVPKGEIERFVLEHASWIDTQLKKQASWQLAHPEPDEDELIVLRLKARELIPQRVEYYASIMQLYPSAVKINAAKTRFGSCSGKNSLNFSCRLLLYPPAAIDYVVVHELAHIRHKNHGGDFWALVASILPDYKQRKAMLRQ